MVHTGTTPNTTPKPIHLSQLQQILLFQIRHNLPNRIFYTRLLAINQNFRLLRLLIRRADASELLDLARARLLIQSLGIPLLRRLDGDVDENLDEGQGFVFLVGRGRGVQAACYLAVGFVWRDEGGDGNGGAIGEEFGDLDTIRSVICFSQCYACQLVPRERAHYVLKP
jgi:hypothetical protein